MINREVIFGSLIFHWNHPQLLHHIHLTGFKDSIGIPVFDSKMVHRNILNMLLKISFTFELNYSGTSNTAPSNPWMMQHSWTSSKFSSILESARDGSVTKWWSVSVSFPNESFRAMVLQWYQSQFANHYRKVMSSHRAFESTKYIQSSPHAGINMYFSQEVELFLESL